MFERFTDRARQAVELAHDEAMRLNHSYIGTEHLLLGLIREGEGVAAQALEALGISLDGVRQQVEQIIGEGQQAPPPGEIPYTPRAKKVLELALREAKQLGHNYIGTEHLLLGVAREDGGVASQILRDAGLDAKAIRDGVMHVLSRPSEKEVLPESFEPQSPPLAPDVAAELARLSREKEEALQRNELERAAWLRERERNLIGASRQLGGGSCAVLITANPRHIAAPSVAVTCRP